MYLPRREEFEPRGSGPPGGPPEGTLKLHFIPIVISDDDEEWENEAVDPTTTTPSRSTTKKLGTEKILAIKNFLANDTSKQNKNNANNVPTPKDETETTRTR